MGNNPSQSDEYFTLWNYISDAGAGLNFSIQQLQSSRRKLCFVSFLFTTDANVASRKIKIGIEKAGNFFPLSGCNITQPNNLAMRYFFSISAGFGVSSADAFRHGSLPDVYCIFGEDYTQSQIENIQAGDALTDIALVYACQPTGRYI